MAFDFPSSPTLNQTYSFGSKTWIYNGTGWALTAYSNGSPSFTATNGSNALTQGMLVYIDSSGLVQKADATSEGKEAIGYVNAAVSAGATATVFCQGGVITGLSALTTGSSYYLSTTAGGIVIAASAPSTVGSGNVLQKVGIALSTTTLLFQPGIPVTL